MDKSKSQVQRDVTASLLRNYDLVSLRLLLSAIDEGNLTKVAAREDVSLSAVSRRISDLEARIGVKLLHRRDRGIVPTDAAEANITRLRSLFNLIDLIIEDLQGVRDGDRGMVRVHAHLNAICGALPAAVATFIAKFPSIDVLVDEATSTEIVHAVQVGECDIGLVSGAVDPGTLTILPWMTDELVVVLPQGHPLQAQDALRFVDVLDYPFIGMTPGKVLHTLFRRQATVLGRELAERVRVGTYESVQEMVAAGLGVGILPAAVASKFPEMRGLILRRLDEPWAARSLVICFRDRARLSGAGREFLDHLGNRN